MEKERGITIKNVAGNTVYCGLAHVYSIGDTINVISFGKPAKEKLLEWSEENKMFKCGFMPGNGSCWRTIEDIEKQKERVTYFINHTTEQNNRYWLNGGDLGPTGHGDICYSDADSGL